MLKSLAALALFVAPLAHAQVVFLPLAAEAPAAEATPATSTTPATTLTATAPPQGWGLAGDALTVGAGGVGAVLGVAALYGAAAVAGGDGSLPAASLAVPVLVPGLAAGAAAAVQPNAGVLDIAAPAVGASVGTVVGGVSGIAAVALVPGISEGVGGVVAMAGGLVGGALAGTAGGVVLAHAFDDDGE